MGIEGAELLALRGAKEVLSRPRPPVLIVEITSEWIVDLGGSMEELVRQLQLCNYEPYLIAEDKITPVHFADIPMGRQFDLFCRPAWFDAPSAFIARS